jgi:hypothetical protein
MMKQVVLRVVSGALAMAGVIAFIWGPSVDLEPAWWKWTVVAGAAWGVLAFAYFAITGRLRV